MMKNILKKSTVLALAFAYVLLITRAALIPATHEDSRHFIRGDGFSDQNVYSTVLWVRDFGFWESKLRAVLFYKGDGNKAGAEVYTHYPSYPDILIAAYSRALDTVNEPLLRTLPIALSLLLVFLVYQCLKIFPMSSDERSLNFILFLLSGYFIFWADNLHKHLHEYIVLWGTVYLLWNYYQTPTTSLNSKLKICLWFLPLTFVATQCSFETYVIVATLVVGTSLAFEKGIRKVISPLNIYLGVLFILGLGLHLYLNRLYFGSWELTIADMKASYMQRIGAGAEDEKMTLLKYLELPLRFVNRQERYFFVPGYALIVFLWVYLKKLKQSGHLAAYKMLWVMVAASVSWYFFMSQHAFMHHFTAKHFGLVAIIISAPGIFWWLQEWELLRKESWTLKKSGMALLGAYVLIMALTQIVYPVWWKHSLKFLVESIFF